MLDLMVIQLRHEEMLREAEQERRLWALLRNQRPSQTGILTLIKRAFESKHQALVRRANEAQPARMRSRNT